ncbi:MAG: hypothetical protein R3B60_03545 [Candidatus Paceibacterota bacterium]
MNKETKPNKKTVNNKNTSSVNVKRFSAIYKVSLYRYVYKTLPSYLGVFVLLCSFFLQGVGLAYANEVAKPIAETMVEEIGVYDEDVEENENNEGNKKKVDTRKIENLPLTDNKKISEESLENKNEPKENNSKDKEGVVSIDNNDSPQVDVIEKKQNITSKSETFASSSYEKTQMNKETVTEMNNNSSTSITTTNNFEIEKKESKRQLDNASSTKKASSTNNLSEDVYVIDEKDFQETYASSTQLQTKQSSTSSTVDSVDANVQTKSVEKMEDKINVINEVDENDKTVFENKSNENQIEKEPYSDQVNDNQESLDNINTEEKIAIATTATSSLKSNEPLVAYVKNDTAFQFNENDCTKLATGSYYCYESADKHLKDDLFAAPDEDGDLEIFLTKENKQIQLTHNNVPDASPYYDEKTNTIVWHRMISDRYQIILYDLDTKKETQLTNDTVNNTEPAKQGNYVVWQRWTGNSWNIILYDGKKQEQITDGNDHNMGPRIQGSLVIWNKHNRAGEKTIEMYDITTGNILSVNDPEGLSVDNPRMVLVYDSLHANGDIVTKGYDIFSKEFIQLDTLPRDLPDKIPDSESTNEIRAMIQTKPSVKTLDVKNDIDDDIDLDEFNQTDNVSTSTKPVSADDDLTLNMKSISTDSDLEINTKKSETEQSVNTVSDMEILPFEKTERSISTDGM